MSHAAVSRVTFNDETIDVAKVGVEDDGEGQGQGESQVRVREAAASRSEAGASGEEGEGEMKVVSKVLAATSKSAAGVVGGSRTKAAEKKKSVEVVVDVDGANEEKKDEKKEEKKGASKAKGKGKTKDKSGKGSGGAKKDKAPKSAAKKASMAQTTSVVGLTNDELVKKFSQTQSQGALKSHSSLKSKKSKTTKSKLFAAEEEEEEDDEEEGGGYGQGKEAGEGHEEEEEIEGEEGKKKKSIRRSRDRSATEKGGEESPEIQDKDKDDQLQSKVSIKKKRNKMDTGEESADKENAGKQKKKKKKKGKKGKKGTRVTIEEEEEEEEDVDKSRVSLKGDKSGYSTMGRSILSTDRSEMLSSLTRRKEGIFEDSQKSIADGQERQGSSSSSSEAVSRRRRQKRLAKKTSKKVAKKDVGDEAEYEGGVEEEEELLQKIVDPSVTFSASTFKPKKTEKPKKAKKPKKKKTDKDKQKKRVTFVKTEAQLEEEAKAIAEEARIRALEEKRDAIAREKRELLEASMREEQLDLTAEARAECAAALEEVGQEEQAAEEWRQYLVCDGLPAPWDVPAMNTYIHLWDKEVYTVSSDRCKERTTEAINLLDKLEAIIEDPFDKSERKIADWTWVAARFRSYQALNLEYCTYRLLRDIKSKMNRIDIPTADFRMQEDLFALCLWVSITLPTPAPNPRVVARPRIALSWPEMAVELLFPAALKRDMVAIRGMYTKYDHVTDTCESYRVGPLPTYYRKTLKEVCDEEIKTKMRYKYDHRVIHKAEPVEVIQEDGTVALVEPEPEPEPPADDIAPKVPYQKLEVSASEHYQFLQADEVELALQQLAYPDLPSDAVNLRKYTVLGGLYYLDLFYQPPQPQGMVSYEVFISTLTAPYSLQTAPFAVKYEPPPVPEPGARRTPEEIEEELLQQEKELDELIFMQITLPKHVYWLETPSVVQWDGERATWTSGDVFDFKYLEEQGYVTFRTGIFRPIGIATLRWSNLPYQAWEIRPERDGTVTFQLSCAILTLEFHARKNTICVRDVQSAPNEALDPHLDVYYPFSKLRKIMRSIGVDVFPFFDTFLYVEGACEKDWPMEDHLYFIMAYLSVVYNMTWSRWNMTLDRRSIVYQMRMYRFDRPKQANFDTVLVRAQSTALIACTEVSQEFTEEPAPGMRFFADLWHLVRTTTTKSTRQRITNADKTMVTTLYRLYKNVRFLSFS